MNYTGYHVVLDIFGCCCDELEDTDCILNKLEGVTELLDTKIVSKTYHKFEPQGLSAAFIISASHITIHTWPENGYIGVDIFTCSECFDKDIVVDYFKNNIQCKEIICHKIYRGVFSDKRNKIPANPIYCDKNSTNIVNV